VTPDETARLHLLLAGLERFAEDARARNRVNPDLFDLGCAGAFGVAVDCLRAALADLDDTPRR
jgi:hypothetical protein